MGALHYFPIVWISYRSGCLRVSAIETSQSPSAQFLSVDTDITKPDKGALSISRPHHRGESTTTTGTFTSPQVTTPENERVQYTEPLSEGEDDDEDKGEYEVLEGGVLTVFATVEA